MQRFASRAIECQSATGKNARRLRATRKKRRRPETRDESDSRDAPALERSRRLRVHTHERVTSLARNAHSQALEAGAVALIVRRRQRAGGGKRAGSDLGVHDCTGRATEFSSRSPVDARPSADGTGHPLLAASF
jgi:hypothetical protein